ncbi:hypothetical protein NLJ89_g7151 [Agrocybe chaxingu]|uniref:Uncharacterized protein n=1 Tax=Agrocybe chaxingu TaxID=84603 RepID=A0A9W8JWX2_9AGAR|nr:hypothetical protein NLJ89_g7151 [Agrocybe chaxingu]
MPANKLANPHGFDHSKHHKAAAFQLRRILPAQDLDEEGFKALRTTLNELRREYLDVEKTGSAQREKLQAVIRAKKAASKKSHPIEDVVGKARRRHEKEATPEENQNQREPTSQEPEADVNSSQKSTAMSDMKATNLSSQTHASQACSSTQHIQVDEGHLDDECLDLPNLCSKFRVNGDNGDTNNADSIGVGLP